MSDFFDKLKRDLKIDEGFRGKAYQDTVGKWTVGYGHNIEDNPIPEDIADALLINDMENAYYDCRKSLDWFGRLPEDKARVIVNMVFNMGLTRFLTFKKMIAHIETGNWYMAAHEMADSKWFDQVGDRAIRLIALMISECVVD